MKSNCSVIGNNINGGGRGLNAAIVDSTHFQVVAVTNFDLYSQNSSSLEQWLTSQVLDNDIIIIFTFDEASKELSHKAKMSLYRLGNCFVSVFIRSKLILSFW